MRSLVGRQRSAIANRLGILLEQLGARLIHRFGAPLSSICHERLFYVEWALCYARRPKERRRAAAQLLRQEVVGERRVSLIEYDGWFAVRIEVRRPGGWADISLGVDRNLAFEVASRRLAEQQARTIEQGA